VIVTENAYIYIYIYIYIISDSVAWRSVITLLRSKCLPILLYATEACPQLARDLSSLEFTTTRVSLKIFRKRSSAIIAECQRNFNFLSVQQQLIIRTAKFLEAFAASDKSSLLIV